MKIVLSIKERSYQPCVTNEKGLDKN